MIHWLALVFTVSAWAQSPSKFERYCNQLAAPVPEVSAHPNVQVSNLRDVVDAVNNLPKHMRDAVVMGEDYQSFKARMAKKNVPLNDDVHAPMYAQTARYKCEILAGTEAGAGSIGAQAHNSPTDEQLNRRVNDSGIGVTQGISESGTTSETER